MAHEYNPKLHALLVRIAREAPAPDIYDVKVVRMRADDSTFTVNVQLGPDKKDDVPWDTLGGIRCIQWHPGGVWRNHGLTQDGDKRYIEVKTDEWFGGIMVYTGYGKYTSPLDRYMPNFESCTIGINGAMRVSKVCVMLPDEDAVVARVIKMINFGYEVVSDKAKNIDDF